MRGHHATLQHREKEICRMCRVDSKIIHLDTMLSRGKGTIADNRGHTPGYQLYRHECSVIGFGNHILYQSIIIGMEGGCQWIRDLLKALLLLSLHQCQHPESLFSKLGCRKQMLKDYTKRCLGRVHQWWEEVCFSRKCHGNDQYHYSAMICWNLWHCLARHQILIFETKIRKQTLKGV